MKIAENTDDRLVLVDRTWLIAGVVWLMGLVALYSAVTGADMDGWGERLLVLCLGLGACSIAWWFMGFLTITFDRPAGKMVREIHRIGRTSRTEISLATIERARLQAERGESGSRMERLALETADGPVPLELGFSGFGRERFETAINHWLAD